MLPSKIDIKPFTISLSHRRRFIPSSNYPENEIKTGETTIEEYNIDNIINELKIKNNVFESEYRCCLKEILKFLTPFLVKIIEKSILLKCIYSFGLYIPTPHEFHVIIKDIEVVLDSEDPQGTAERLIKSCIDKMNNNFINIDEDFNTNLVLLVTRIEVYDGPQQPRYLNIYKEDDCIICTEEKSDILFYDCGHLVICFKCAYQLENNICPICRAYNKTIHRIHS